MTNIDAYPLPDDPDPQQFVCYKVYLPVGAGFSRAFWGSMSHLAKWVAWQRDDGHNATLAARSMKEANDLTQTAWLTEGCCQVVEPPYVDDLPDGRTPVEGTIDDWLWTLFEVITEINTRINASQSCEQIVSDLAPVWLANTGSSGVQIITDLCSDMSGQTPAERAELVDVDNWQELRDQVVCEIETTGDCPSLFGLSSPEDFYSWLNCASAKVYAVLDFAASGLYDILNGSAAILAGNEAAQQISSAGGGGSGFGFGTATCYWSHSIDFTIEDGEWTDRAEDARPYGVWIDTVGWHSVYWAGQLAEALYIQYKFAETVQITSFLVTVSFTGNPTANKATFAAIKNNGSIVASQGGSFFTPSVGGVGVTNTDVAGDELEISVTANAPSGDSDWIATSVQIQGKGLNPFI